MEEGSGFIFMIKVRKIAVCSWKILCAEGTWHLRHNIWKTIQVTWKADAMVKNNNGIELSIKKSWAKGGCESWWLLHTVILFSSRLYCLLLKLHVLRVRLQNWTVIDIFVFSIHRKNWLAIKFVSFSVLIIRQIKSTFAELCHLIHCLFISCVYISSLQ